MVPNILDDWNATFRAHLEKVEAWLARLDDPAWPQTGQRFLDRVAGTACGRIMNAHILNCTSVYDDFALPPAEEKSFKNRIIYGAYALFLSYPHLFSAHVHELLHALQRIGCAATHATPLNADSNIILCPRDYALLMERTDQEAYAKQAWLNFLFCRETGADPSWTQFDPVSVSDFSHAYTMNDLQQTLSLVARNAVLKDNFRDTGGNSVSLRDSVHSFALARYRDAVKRRLESGERLTFVQLEDRDIINAGASFGPNPFGTDGLDSIFADPPVLSGENERMVAELNALVGIADENGLPSFSEALSADGMDRETFIAHSRAGMLRKRELQPAALQPETATAIFSVPPPP